MIEMCVCVWVAVSKMKIASNKLWRAIRKNISAAGVRRGVILYSSFLCLDVEVETKLAPSKRERRKIKLYLLE